MSSATATQSITLKNQEWSVAPGSYVNVRASDPACSRVPFQTYLTATKVEGCATTPSLQSRLLFVIPDSWLDTTVNVFMFSGKAAGGTGAYLPIGRWKLKEGAQTLTMLDLSGSEYFDWAAAASGQSYNVTLQEANSPR